MRICTSPVRNSCIALMRAFWPLLLCTARTPFSNERSRNLKRFSASSFRRVKISSRSSPSFSRTYHSMKAILVRRLGRGSLYWVTVATGVLSGVTSIRVGHSKNSSASRSTRGGNVAEKRMFCRLVGTTSCTCRICGMNPMSIMRSASSKTMCFNFFVSTCPRE